MLLGQQPRQRVAGAAGGKREDDADGLAADLGVRGQRECATSIAAAARMRASWWIIKRFPGSDSCDVSRETSVIWLICFT